MRKEALCILTILLFSVFISGCTNKIQEEQVTDRSLLNIQERGKLIVGTTAELPPLEYRDENGSIVGGDVEITKEIASTLGIADVEFKHFPWEDMLKAAETGEVDFSISSIVITPARTERMLFSIPYVDAGQVIVVRKDNENIKGPEDLKNFKVGAVKGTTNEKAALEYADPSKYVAYDNFDTLVNDTIDGKIDANVIDYIIGLAWINKNPSLKIVGEPFTQQYYGIATKLGNNALMDEINKILREMKRTGRLKEILEESVKK